MSRESLLDEAIAKAKEAEDWQLVEWLRMARGGESAARWYSDKLREAHRTERKLLDENAKLVMKLNAEHLVRQNVERENAKLRELVRTLHHCAARGECDVCAMRDGRGLDEDTVCLAMHDRMRELGVDA